MEEAHMWVQVRAPPSLFQKTFRKVPHFSSHECSTRFRSVFRVSWSLLQVCILDGQMDATLAPCVFVCASISVAC